MDLQQLSLLRLGDVLQAVQVGRATLYKMIAHDQFPHPVRVGSRAVRWRARDVAEWIDARPTTTAVDGTREGK